MTPSQTPIDPALVAKIKKLLNLSRDASASANEIELAAAHAQRLMMEHNISIATAEAADTSARSLATRTKATAKGKAAYAWQRNLMGSVAHANFCMVFTRHDPNGRSKSSQCYEVIGREENVAAATNLFDYLTGAIERLARDYVKEGRLVMSNAAMSFKDGASARLQSRIYAQHREEMAEAARAATATAASTSNALVPIMADFAEAEECANEDFRLGLKAGTTAANRYKYSVRHKAWEAANDACSKADTKDKELLTQVARAAAEAIVGASGLVGQEACDAMAAAVHQALYAATAKPSKGHRGRSYRYRAGSQKRVNYEARDAGGEAGNRISLNRQVDAPRQAVRIG